ncbi:metalloprotease [Irpex rosettiformis]|uniref:Metalloprotease n=1 Tax=Irpex rosettiformis TaxID=378272 RepID=A0ACB8U6Q0_9APHY|nr:metalloprotease [Irpex rosettiformis]
MAVDIDPITQTNYTQITTTHVHLDWTVDFEAKRVVGSATHTLEVKEDGVKQVILDAFALEIEKVEVEGGVAKYELGPSHPVMGSALIITLPSPPPAGSTIKTTIWYHTTERSTALQFLDKEQTQGNKFPYLFSQCQPIYARSLLPVQDTSAVKITYSANVKSVLPVLLSAVRVSPPSDGPAHGGKVVGKDVVTYVYEQTVPIPSYLIAIAAGNVVYRGFHKVPGKTWTSGIWAEPELIDAAYWEFSEDTTKFMEKVEEILPPYRFKVYDLLVLPPSFPFGGMENACLSFLTPTLLAGDRTLVDVVAHELSHSWFGNGVTQAHATHFWLNEGWTTWMERLLLAKLHTPAERDFSYLIGLKSLEDALKMYEKQTKYQRLVIEFEKGEDPDDAYLRVPYDKGANLILHIERTLGGLDVFLPYVNDYVNTFMGKSITTQEWKDHLYAYYNKHGGSEKIKLLDSIDWNAWFYGEGLLLPVKLEYDTSLAEAAYALADRWNASRSTTDLTKLDFETSDVDNFNSNQKCIFLECLQNFPSLPTSHLTHLGTLYHLSNTPNVEIRYRFYALALLDTSSDAAKHFVAEAIKWVVGEDGTGIIKGRMKFCRPILRATFAVDKDGTVETYRKHRSAFHPIAQKTVDKDLGLVL